MKISIVTPTFNSARTLRDTLDSILMQSYQDYEVLLQDAVSNDGTIEIAKEYEPRFKGKLKIESVPDRGLYDGFNKGVARATGEIVGVLNSDDFYYDNQVLERIANAMMNPSIGCVYGNLQFVDAQDTSKVVRVWIGSQYSEGGFFKGWHPAHPTFYARRRFFEEYGSFDTTFRVSADFELMLRFIERYKVNSLYIPHYFINMRIGGESTGSISNIIKGNINNLRAFEKNGFKRPPFYILRRLTPKFIDLIKLKIKYLFSQGTD